MYKLAAATREDLSVLKPLYLEAFPREERAPFRLLWRKYQQGKADFWKVMADGANEPIGLAYMLHNDTLAYLFYFAIAREKRGQGCGTQTLRLLMERYAGKRFFLALERLDESDAPNQTERQKRHAFYEHCGLHDLPYHLKEASVVYAIMGNGAAVQPEEYGRLMDNWSGWLWRRLVDMRLVD